MITVNMTPSWLRRVHWPTVWVVFVWCCILPSWIVGSNPAIGGYHRAVFVSLALTCMFGTLFVVGMFRYRMVYQRALVLLTIACFLVFIALIAWDVANTPCLPASTICRHSL